MELKFVKNGKKEGYFQNLLVNDANKKMKGEDCEVNWSPLPCACAQPPYPPFSPLDIHQGIKEDLIESYSSITMKRVSTTLASFLHIPL